MFRKKIQIKERGRDTQILAAFCDLRGFTKATRDAHLAPEQVAKIAGHFYTHVVTYCSLVEAYFKPAGDGLLVVCDLPTDYASLKNRVDMIVRQIVKMYDAFIVPPGLFPITLPANIGIGVARGSATCINVAGVGAAPELEDYFGYVVNLASKLQSLARPAGVILEAQGLEPLVDEELKEKFIRDWRDVPGEGMMQVLVYGKAQERHWTLDRAYETLVSGVESMWLRLGHRGYRYREREVEYAIELDSALSYTERIVVCGGRESASKHVFVTRHGVASNEAWPEVGSAQFTVRALDMDGRDVIPLVSVDRPTQKKVLVVYCPPITSPTDCREVLLSCRWPAFWKPLFQLGEDTFSEEPCAESEGTIERLRIRVVMKEGVPFRDLTIFNKSAGQEMPRGSDEVGGKVWRWDEENANPNREYRFDIKGIR